MQAQKCRHSAALLKYLSSSIDQSSETVDCGINNDSENIKRVILSVAAS